MAAVEIRRATAGDCEAVAEMCALLWPDGPLEEHAAELREKLASGLSGPCRWRFLWRRMWRAARSRDLWKWGYVRTRSPAIRLDRGRH
jgi:hypothetical protein